METVDEEFLAAAAEFIKKSDNAGQPFFCRFNTAHMHFRTRITTDNGPHTNSWPDAATTPFRSEKHTNWEGAFRVPCLLRWPGKIPAGSVSNEIVSHLDFLPTFLATAGEPDIKNKLLQGHKAGDKTFKVHLDGYNLLPYLSGVEKKSPRPGFIYFNDDGDLVAATTTGRSCSWSSACKAPARFGRSLL
jgi:arylsulfatase